MAAEPFVSNNDELPEELIEVLDEVVRRFENVIPRETIKQLLHNFPFVSSILKAHSVSECPPLTAFERARLQVTLEVTIVVRKPTDPTDN